MSIQFFIPGDPLPQPRQRHRIATSGSRQFVKNYTPSKHPVQDWKAIVALAAESAADGCYFGRGVALRLEMEFTFSRPVSHFKKSGGLTKSAPAAKTAKPDLDNLAKAVKDALNGVIWHDDSQVVAMSISKAWAESRPGLSVSISTIQGANHGKITLGRVESQ